MSQDCVMFCYGFVPPRNVLLALLVFYVLVWLLSCVQRRHEKVRMIARMMIGELLSVGSPRIRHKPRMMLGWCEGGGWMVPGSLG